jgi:Anti-sigma-28 factor, FlgM
MQISSISTTQLFSLGISGTFNGSSLQDDTAESHASSSDGVALNFSADTFSSLVKEANAMPEVRSEVVDAYKARIHSGHYPSEDIVAGLTNLMGGAIAQQLKAQASSKKF